MRSLWILGLFVFLIGNTAYGAMNKNTAMAHTAGTPDNDKLTSHTWISYYVTEGMDDVSSSTSITLNFKSDGSLSATGFDALGWAGSWTLDNGVLDLGDGGKWSVIMLTDSELRLRSTTDTSEMYFK